MSTQPRTLTPQKVGVKTIPTADLKPNPHNPRMLFDREPLDVLKASIAKVGILVPLTVYWSDAKRSFFILDGQRRWMCAQELALATVPVNQVAEPSLVQNIVTMFQIHKLREDWELMPTALKLELLMREMDERRDRHLAELTGLDQAVVVRCKKLLTFPKKYQDQMLDPDPRLRVKADFFIELYPVLHDRTVKSMPWFHASTFTERMLARYKSGHLKAVTDFRTIKQHITNAVKARRSRQISARLQEYSTDSSLSLEHLALPDAAVGAQVRALLKTTDKLIEQLQALDVEDIYGEELLWARLIEVAKLLQEKLRAANRRV